MPYKDPEKRKACLKRYNTEHADELREYKRLYAARQYQEDPAHREEVKARRRQRYSKNRELESAKKSAKWFANHEENKAKNRATKRRLYWANPGHYRTYQIMNTRRWKDRNPDKWADQIERNKQAILDNPTRFRTYRMEYMRRHPWRRMVKAMFTRTKSIMSGKVTHGRKSTLLGCSPKELRDYIEGQFDPWMNWGNYGKDPGCWSLDHRVPLAAWNLNDPNEQAAAMHYTNLCPMEHIANIRKSSFHMGKKHWHNKDKGNGLQPP